MSLIIDNEPRSYDWGTSGGIGRIRGVASRAFHTGTAEHGIFPVTDADAPEAELWLGTHPSWPSVVSEGPFAGLPLPEALRQSGHPAEVGFLLKLLAVERPLSVQVHPNAKQARAGFERENEAGVGIAASERNYRDPNAKAEMLYVLSETFELCAGFRTLEETAIDLRRALQPTDGAERAFWNAFVTQVETGGTYEPVLRWLLDDDGAAAKRATAYITDRLSVNQPVFGVERDTLAQRLIQAYPGDSGIALSLLLGHELLRRGQAIYLEPRIPHFYIGGVGVELMSPSDNVLRAGLTTKHVDTAELLAVVNTDPALPRHLFEYHKGPMTVFHAPDAGLRLAIGFTGAEPVPVEFHPGDIAYVLDGSLDVLRADDTVQHVSAGQAVVLTDATAATLNPVGRGGSVVVAGATPIEG